MHVGPARDERQRDATPRRLTNFACALFFPPDPWGVWPPRTRCPRALSPIAPSTLCPVPGNCALPCRHTPPIPPATSPRRIPPGAIVENADGDPRWHCQIPSARLSTDTPVACAAHRRSRQRPGATRIGFRGSPSRPGADTCAWPNARRTGIEAVLPSSRKLVGNFPRFYLWHLGVTIFALIPPPVQLLFYG